MVIVNAEEKLEPIFGYFKRGMTHIAVVTKTIISEYRDPEKKVIGIVTMEDIIEEIIDDEIEDETRTHLENHENKVKQSKKLSLLFSDTTAQQQLTQEHIYAIKEFLSTNVRPFKNSCISNDKLQVLIKKSEVLSFKTDNKIFSTNIW
jgi:metal transporter CNNM